MQRRTQRNFPAAVAALILLSLTGVAAAQLGRAPETVVAALADYQPAPEGDGYVVASGFRFTVTAAAGVAVEVGAEGSLTDANVRFLGSLVGAASGYGDSIAAPVADFFRTRASDLAGVGEVAVEVMEYLMYVEVAAGEPGFATVRFVPQYVPDERFGSAAHAIGPEDAAHVVRLFTDLECPYCAQFDALGMPVVEHGLLPRGDVRFELHHFPLKTIHPNAVAAAEATECVAAAAGEAAFWAYQSALFVAQGTWAGKPDPLPEFVKVADDLGLPSAELPACVRSGEFGAMVEESYRKAAQDLRLTGTPTVFVDGLKIGDYRDLDDYLRLMRLGAALRERAELQGAP